jgi:hypothetical protein
MNARRLGIVSVVAIVGSLIPGIAAAAAVPLDNGGHPCGNYEQLVGTENHRFFGNCSIGNTLINVDTILAPDYHLCVPANQTRDLGSIRQVRGASQIGTC